MNCTIWRQTGAKDYSSGLMTKNNICIQRLCHKTNRVLFSAARYRIRRSR